MYTLLKRTIGFIAVMIGISCAHDSFAQCAMIEVPLPSRVQSASLVIEGKVTAKSSFWNAQGNRIYTSNTIEVYKVFKGSAVSEIAVITEGGIIGNQMQKVEPSLQLEEGETGIFFMEAAPVTNPSVIVPQYRAYASAQGFIRYDIPTATAADVFRKYNDIGKEVYQPILKKAGKKNYYEVRAYTISGAQQKQSGPGNNNTQMVAPTIASFTPATITAGTGSILTITGNNFQATQGTGYVEFRSADDGGATFIQPLASQYVSWTNTQIQVRVPQRAGTGTFRVVNSTVAPNSVLSATPLTVTYSQLNVVTGGNAFQPDHINDNTTGGYTFQYENGFASNALATAAFQRAVERWRCNTYINWNIGANTATNTVAGDGINIVRFDVGAELAAGLLGVCTSYWNSCAAGVWYVVELDVTFDSGATWQFGPALATGAQYDFESVAMHELGHGHQLGHVINPGGDVMHYALTNGTNVRNLTADNIAAGTYVMGQSTVANSCGPGVMVALNSSNCALGSPTAAFTGTPTSTCASSLTVNFTDQSTGTPTAWAWDIDNNGTTDYTTQNPTHTYTTPGVYSVKLTVSNSAGSNTLTQTSYITVGSTNTINSIATGNWNNAATWAGGIIPGACDHAIINHIVTVTAAATVGNVTVNSGGNLTTNSALTNNGTFTVNNGGTYTHNNATNPATTIFNGTESFGPTSTIRVDNWVDGNTPLATSFTGNFGHVTLNYVPGGPPGSAWVQNGRFSTNQIMGTLTILATQINMDNGTGNTNALTLQDVVISGTGGMIVRTATNAPGTTVPGGTFTLNTGNVTHGGSSGFCVLYEAGGTLNWTLTGNLTITQDMYITKGIAGKVHVTNVTISGNLGIGMTAPDAFDVNYLAVGASHATVTVGGTTTISADPDWVRMIDRGPGGTAAASVGNLVFNTGTLLVNAGMDNAFQLGDGNATINVTNNFTVTMGETSVIGEYGGLFAPVAAQGTVNVTVGGNFSMTGAAATCNFMLNYTNLGNGNINMNVTGNFLMSATNGFFEGTYGGQGDFNLTIGGALDQNDGSFYGIYNNYTGAVPGKYTFNLGSVDFDGGFFSAYYSANTLNETLIFNVTGNCDINYTATADFFSPSQLATVGTTVNTTAFDMDVGGNLIFSGLAGNFRSNTGSGAETIDVIGNVTCSGGANNFNVVINSGVTTGHAVTTNVGGSVTVSGGTLRLSAELGAFTGTINGDVNVSGGVLTVKGDDGLSTLNVLGGYNQTGGTFFIHESPAAADFTADVITITINSDNNATGNFSKTGGTLNFDNNIAAGAATHQLIIKSPSVTLGGAAANDITRGGAGTGALYGEIHFARGAAGPTTYDRSTINHRIQQVRQYIDAGTTVDATATVTDLQVASNGTQANIGTNALVVNGTLTMGVNKITAVGPSLTNYFSGISIGSGGRLRTANTAGFYDGTTNACLQPQAFATNTSYRMDLNLNANSIVEYYASANQTVTGKFPNAGVLADVATATAAQYKYGILDINNQGTLGTNFAFPAVPAAGTGNVFVRTTLVLTRGELNLAGSGTGQTITIENGAAAAIDRNGTTTTGYIKSEEANAGNNRAKVLWNMGTATGAHVYPFGVTTGAANYVPFTFNKTTAGAANITVSTRSTAVTNNTPWPAASNVAAVGNMYSGTVGGDGSVPAVIDRWWDITTSAAVTANLVFTYRGAENTMSAGYQAGALGAQHWNGTSWDAPIGTGTGVTAGTGTVSVTGANTFSPWVLSAIAAPLPIELLHFEPVCQDDDVLLKWSTATETNNDYFTVEKSYDGTSFHVLAIVDGAGTSTSMNNYSAIDRNVNTRTYYRLKQTDFDGATSHSPLVTSGGCSEEEESMYALLNEDALNIIFTSGTEQELTFTVYNVAGQKLTEQKTTSVKGMNLIELPAHQLSNGIYFITLYSSSRTYTAKVAVNK